MTKNTGSGTRMHRFKIRPSPLLACDTVQVNHSMPSVFLPYRWDLKTNKKLYQPQLLWGLHERVWARVCVCGEREKREDF